jgi:hypothetical protein
MHGPLRWRTMILVAVVMLGMNTASADPGHGRRPKMPRPKPHKAFKPDQPPRPDLRVNLSGRQEVPFVVSDGQGTFEGTLNDAGDQLTYTLSYSGLNGTVEQAHIHVGQRFAAGGISVFLCSNLDNGPAGTQACPPAPSQISGTIIAADVVGPPAQGVGPGDLADLLTAIGAGQAYVNVHTDTSPGGEIRGQLHLRPPRPDGHD